MRIVCSGLFIFSEEALELCSLVLLTFGGNALGGDRLPLLPPLPEQRQEVIRVVGMFRDHIEAETLRSTSHRLSNT